MIRRFLPLALVVLAAAAAAAGCGSSSKSSSAGTTTTAATTTSANPTGSAHSSTFSVGLNTDTGGLNDRGFNHLAYLGVLQAVKQLGIHYKVTESASPADYIPNLSSLARQIRFLRIGL